MSDDFCCEGLTKLKTSISEKEKAKSTNAKTWMWFIGLIAGLCMTGTFWIADKSLAKMEKVSDQITSMQVAVEVVKETTNGLKDATDELKDRLDDHIRQSANFMRLR